MTSLQLKLTALILIINAVVTIYYHHAGKLVIYKDYTDATFTGLAPLVAIVTNIVLQFFEAPETVSHIFSVIVFLCMMVFVVKSTAEENSGLSVFFVMSLVTKVTVVGLYYGIMFMLLFDSGSGQRKGESSARFEARRRREAKATAATAAASTGLFVTLSMWVCKVREFSSFRAYVLGDESPQIE